MNARKIYKISAKFAYAAAITALAALSSPRAARAQAPARLLLDCDPPDALVELRPPAGAAPALPQPRRCHEEHAAPPGRYQLEVYAVGRARRSEAITLVPGANRRRVLLSESPEARGLSTLRLALSAAPQEPAPWPLDPPLRIFVDGHERARDALAQGVGLYPGPHSVEVRAERGGLVVVAQLPVTLPGPAVPLELTTRLRVCACGPSGAARLWDGARAFPLELHRDYPVRPGYDYEVECETNRGRDRTPLRLALGEHRLLHFARGAREPFPGSALSARVLRSREVAVLPLLGSPQLFDVRFALGLLDRRFGDGLTALELGLGVAVRHHPSWSVIPTLYMRGRLYDRKTFAVGAITTLGGVYVFDGERSAFEVTTGPVFTGFLQEDRWSLTLSPVLLAASDRICPPVVPYAPPPEGPPPTAAALRRFVTPASELCYAKGLQEVSDGGPRRGTIRSTEYLDRVLFLDAVLRLIVERRLPRQFSLFGQIELSLRDLALGGRPLWRAHDGRDLLPRPWFDHGVRVQLGFAHYWQIKP